MKKIAATIALSTLAATGAEAQEERRRIAPAPVYEVAPALGRFTDDLLFGEVWARPVLSPRDRSLITMAALIAIGQPEQLPFHAGRAMDNGLSRDEAAEVPAHLAFYAGWPRAMSAVPVLEQVFAGRAAAAAAGTDLRVIPAAPEAATPGPDAYFTGEVKVYGHYQGDAPARIGGATVAFAPGARTAWHTHPLGQTLFISEGRGLVQKDGGPVLKVGPGDVVWIPPMTRHWHGAAPDAAMTHFAIAEALDGSVVTWMEKVSDAACPSGG